MCMCGLCNVYSFHFYRLALFNFITAFDCILKVIAHHYNFIVFSTFFSSNSISSCSLTPLEEQIKGKTLFFLIFD